MRVSFLFWNLCKKDKPALLDSISRLAASGIDVFLFAESPDDPAILTTALNRTSQDCYNQVEGQSRRVLFFSRLKDVTWAERFVDRTGGRIAVQELTPSGGISVLIVGAHLKSAKNLSSAGRAEWAREVAKDIRAVEMELQHRRTILVGDLNMNPFDAGLVETSAFHAVMSKELAVSVQDLEARKGYPPFYNPMWSHFGDRPFRPGDRSFLARRPSGTYFYENTDDKANHFWNMYDQVLLCAELIDHLPIRFEMNL